MNQILKRYIQFREYNLDCEYTRSYDDPKRRSDGMLIIPDIVLHKRGSNDNNLVVIEFKGWWSKVDQKNDICKIKEMTDPCGEFKYKYGYSIMLNREKKGKDRYRIVPV